MLSVVARSLQSFKPWMTRPRNQIQFDWNIYSQNFSLRIFGNNRFILSYFGRILINYCNNTNTRFLQSSSVFRHSVVHKLCYSLFFLFINRRTTYTRFPATVLFRFCFVFLPFVITFIFIVSTWSIVKGCTFRCKPKVPEGDARLLIATIQIIHITGSNGLNSNCIVSILCYSCFTLRWFCECFKYFDNCKQFSLCLF